MRDVLECAIVEQVCELVTPADLQALEENVRLQNFYLDNYDPENLMWLDNKFHENLFRIARKSQIHSLIQNISIHFDRVRSMSLVSRREPAGGGPGPRGDHPADPPGECGDGPAADGDPPEPL